VIKTAGENPKEDDSWEAWMHREHQDQHWFSEQPRSGWQHIHPRTQPQPMRCQWSLGPLSSAESFFSFSFISCFGDDSICPSRNL
jgi:hypothetical protein